MISAVLAALLGLAAPAAPCPIPRDGLVMEMNEVTRNNIVIFDLATGSESCEIDLNSYPPGIAIAPDGMLYVAVPPTKETELTTDEGRLDVFTPDGRLVMQRRDIPGIDRVDLVGNLLYVQGGGMTFVRGAEVRLPQTLAAYDPKTLRLVRRYDLGDGLAVSVAISSDGRYLAVTYGYPNNHMDILDAATGARLHSVPLARGNMYPAQFRHNRFEVQQDRAAYAVDPRTGRITQIPKRRPPDVQVLDIEGIRYTEVRTPFVLPGQGTQTSEYSRERLSDGKKLSPLIAQGIGGIIGTFHGDPQLALLEPDPSLAPPALPSPQRIAELANAPGMSFDDRVTSRHYTIAGELARIDAPDQQKTFIVDCADGIEITEDTLLDTYSIAAIDPAPAVTPTPFPIGTSVQQPAYLMRFTLDRKPISRNALHSPAASSGDTFISGMAINGHPVQVVNRTVLEYGSLPVPFPSCSSRSFAGEPAPIDPSIVATVADGYATQYGSATPVGQSIVYVAGSEPGGGAFKALLDLENVRVLASVPASRFAVPDGFTLEASRRL